MWFSDIVNELKVKTRKQGIVYNRFYVMQLMRVEGMTVEAIAREFDCTHVNVLHGLKKKDIKFYILNLKLANEIREKFNKDLGAEWFRALQEYGLL